MEQTSFCHLDMLFRGVGLGKADLLPTTAQLNPPLPFSKGEMEKSGMGLFYWLAKAPHWLKTLLSWTAKPFVRSISF